MDLQIAVWSERDVEEGIDLLMDTFSREPWNYAYESRNQVREYFLNSMANNYFLGFAGRRDGRLVALSLGMKKAWIMGMEYYIDTLCVSHDLQGQGIGSRFLGEIEGRLSSLGLLGVMLTTDRSYPACRFYRKCGYESLDELVVLVKGE